MGKKLEVNKEELIATLKHSSLPTILVEGKTDIKIYRWLEMDLNYDNNIQVDILPCGNRDILLDVYTELSNNRNLIFVADKDKYVYTNTIPKQYQNVIFTNGYSIENDLFHGGKYIKEWFDRDDQELFFQLLNEYIVYYATVLEKWINNQNNDFEIKTPYHVLDEKNNHLKYEFLPKIHPSQNTIDYLKKGYDLLIQGHALFMLISKVLNRSDRVSKPNNDSVYEACYKSYESESIKVLKHKIKQRLTHIK